jgi:hypothetical protein
LDVLSQYKAAVCAACRKSKLFPAVGLDCLHFVVIYVLLNFIYSDKIRAADMVKKELLDRAMRQFISDQVMTLSQLETLLSCSQRSVQRYLSKWGGLRSYNHNGKYFSLPVIARFDSFGIWKYQGIGFSRFGNLKDTVVQLVNNSPAGLTAIELGQILGVNAHSFMSQFRIDPRLKRQKWEGRLVYFGVEYDIWIAQKRQRFADQSVSAFPSDVQAVIILVSLLKNPTATTEELVNIMNKEHRGISVTMVERLLEHHGLLKKKMHTSCRRGS